MLTVIVGQIVACDLLHADECYVSSPSPDQGQDRPSSDFCLCCCPHITVAHTFVFDPHEIAVAAPPAEIVHPPLSAPASIEHPPQLS